MSRIDVWVIILAALFVAALAALAMAAEPELQNSSFEESMDPANFACDIAKSWTRWGHWMNRILIVEDEKAIVRFVQLELEHEGYETAVALDGRSGLEAAS